MDYRKFLGAVTEAVLPYLGGAKVDAPGRRYRLAAPPAAPGWYRFALEGRKARALGPAEPEGLGALPQRRGHFVSGRLFSDGAPTARVHLAPAEELRPFALISARQWASGEWLYGGQELETEAEEAVRRTLEDEGSIAWHKGVPASLRAAYAWALIERSAARLHVPATLAEVRPRLLEIAQGGRPAAEVALRALAAERQLAQRELAELAERRRTELAAAELEAARVARRAAGPANAQERVEAALAGAGAELRSCWPAGKGQLEVIFTFLDERFGAIVDEDTLQVLDSGICLGHPPSDRLLTLDSLPAVIREAVRTDQLVILRHV